MKIKLLEGNLSIAFWKTLTWRVVASLTTFLLALFFSKEAILSGALVTTEVITKLIAHYLHERMWLKFAGKFNVPRLSLAKAFSWRIIATTITVLLSLFFLGNVDVAAKIGVGDFFLKLVIYYGHERAWIYFLHKVDNGKPAKSDN